MFRFPFPVSPFPALVIAASLAFPSDDYQATREALVERINAIRLAAGAKRRGAVVLFSLRLPGGDFLPREARRALGSGARARGDARAGHPRARRPPAARAPPRSSPGRSGAGARQRHVRTPLLRSRHA